MHKYVIPIFAVIFRPESTKLFLRGTNNGESLVPHKLREEWRDTSHAVAGKFAGGTSRPLLLFRWKREEALASILNVINKALRDAMVYELEDTPSSACMANEFRGIWVI